jgi:hypothetical protein
LRGAISRWLCTIAHRKQLRAAQAAVKATWVGGRVGVGPAHPFRAKGTETMGAAGRVRRSVGRQAGDLGAAGDRYLFLAVVVLPPPPGVGGPARYVAMVALRPEFSPGANLPVPILWPDPGAGRAGRRSQQGYWYPPKWFTIGSALPGWRLNRRGQGGPAVHCMFAVRSRALRTPSRRLLH